MENKNYSMENSEIHQELLNTLSEFSITSEQLPYHEAVKKYYDFLFSGIPPFEQKLFGEFNIQTTNYEMMTDKQVEEALKIIKKYKPKKLFSGFKLYNHVFASVKFYKNVKAEVLPPEKILWQISGCSADVVRNIRNELSSFLKIDLNAFSKDGTIL